MSDAHFTENDFVKQITEVIEQNLSNEQSGVSELAREMGMSRSNLLRKVKKLTRLSVSQFIRQVRLNRAMEMLKQTSYTVSEVSYQVGFNSTSYFIKCFREYYGYPPGEAEKRDFDESDAHQPAQSHQLAAIMFTDIQGYTALMQQDEEKALQFRNRHRQVFIAVTKKFKGKILQYYGDGTLSIFHSAIDAVKCGVELQLAFRLAPQIPVRIGIHSGDIIVNEEDIIGDGVNVASRIEAYYFLDYNQTEKQYSEQINNYADKALLYDAQLAQSLIAKALFYIYHGEYASALPHLEKALEYNPNSALVINILSDFYTRYVPNTEKYLEYALKGIRLDITSNDSTTASFIYLHVSSAFVQSGFVDEAEMYINKSIGYDPENLYSAYVKAFILYAKNRDLAQTKERLLETLSRDSTRLDVMQEVAKICYFMRDDEAAFRYYKKITEVKEVLNLDIYQVENAKIAMVMRKMGKQEEAEKYMQQFRDYTATDQSVYKELNMAMISAFNGETEKAIEQMKRFSKEENYHYWILLFFEMDPLMDELKALPAFKETIRDIEIKFWNRHEQIKARLEEQQLI